MTTKNKAAQAMAKLRHEKSPKPREFYVEISKKAAIARKRNRKLREKRDEN